METWNETWASMTDHVGVVFFSLSAVKSMKSFSKARVEKQEETVFPADLLCHYLDCCFRDELLIAIQPNAAWL